eukprot:TRINITY_DN2622_c0_g1_i2.p1 TRINITY_DN2622_c0_g1~~TRINITY_DN2622_c0_g1_i2.p1  ORF type:complete len:255 (+),score=65.82 TRINITY_DN2622_c0_g1_i2:681-1445(+)
MARPDKSQQADGPSPTAYWAAPELSTSPPNSKSDIYSYGVLLYEVVEGRLPWPSQARATPAAHGTAKPPFSPSNLIWRPLITICWDENPDNRPAAPQVIAMINALEDADTPPAVSAATAAAAATTAAGTTAATSGTTSRVQGGNAATNNNDGDSDSGDDTPVPPPSHPSASTPAPAATPASPSPADGGARRQCRALCGRAGGEDGELSFKAGDVLWVVTEEDEGWLVCETGGSGGGAPGTRRGRVARNFVEMLL